jgi:hypothetical protein
MKKRPPRRQKGEIRAAQFETRQLRNELSATSAMHPLLIAKVQSSSETEARSNWIGSRAYRKIYPEKPLSAKEIKADLR